MSVFDAGCREHRDRQDGRQQNRSFEIGNGEQQCRCNETQRGNRQSELFGAALHQPDDGDGGDNYQGQNHVDTMTDWWVKFNTATPPCQASCATIVWTTIGTAAAIVNAVFWWMCCGSSLLAGAGSACRRRWASRPSPRDRGSGKAWRSGFSATAHPGRYGRGGARPAEFDARNFEGRLSSLSRPVCRKARPTARGTIEMMLEVATRWGTLMKCGDRSTIWRSSPSRPSAARRSPGCDLPA